MNAYDLTVRLRGDSSQLAAEFSRAQADHRAMIDGMKRNATSLSAQSYKTPSIAAPSPAPRAQPSSAERAILSKETPSAIPAPPAWLEGRGSWADLEKYANRGGLNWEKILNTESLKTRQQVAAEVFKQLTSEKQKLDDKITGKFVPELGMVRKDFLSAGGKSTTFEPASPDRVAREAAKAQSALTPTVAAPTKIQLAPAAGATPENAPVKANEFEQYQQRTNTMRVKASQMAATLDENASKQRKAEINDLMQLIRLRERAAQVMKGGEPDTEPHRGPHDPQNILPGDHRHGLTGFRVQRSMAQMLEGMTGMSSPINHLANKFEYVEFMAARLGTTVGKLAVAALPLAVAGTAAALAWTLVKTEIADIGETGKETFEKLGLGEHTFFENLRMGFGRFSGDLKKIENNGELIARVDKSNARQSNLREQGMETGLTSDVADVHFQQSQKKSQETEAMVVVIHCVLDRKAHV